MFDHDSFSGKESGRGEYSGSSLISNIAPRGPYSKTMPRASRWSEAGVLFLMSEIPLYRHKRGVPGTPTSASRVHGSGFGIRGFGLRVEG